MIVIQPVLALKEMPASIRHRFSSVSRFRRAWLFFEGRESRFFRSRGMTNSFAGKGRHLVCRSRPVSRPEGSPNDSATPSAPKNIETGPDKKEIAQKGRRFPSLPWGEGLGVRG